MIKITTVVTSTGDGSRSYCEGTPGKLTELENILDLDLGSIYI